MNIYHHLTIIYHHLASSAIILISKGEKFLLLPFIVIHVRTSLDEIPHFINCGRRRKDLRTPSKSGNPRKEGRRQLYGQKNYEMLIILRHKNGIFTELVYHGIG